MHFGNAATDADRTLPFEADVIADVVVAREQVLMVGDVAGVLRGVDALLAGALFTGCIGYLGAHFVWENGAHHAFLQFFGMSVGDIPEGPTTPDLEWPTWMVYCAIPFGSSLMSFRFMQVAYGFVTTGELPHHDHAHVEGVEDEAPLVGEALEDGEEISHVHLGQGDAEWAKSHPKNGGTKP